MRGNIYQNLRNKGVFPIKINERRIFSNILIHISIYKFNGGIHEQYDIFYKINPP